MNKEEALKLAEQEGLTVIKVTSSITNPHIGYGVIGFRDVEHLKSVMENYRWKCYFNAWTRKEWGDLWKYGSGYDKGYFEVTSDRFGSYCDEVDWNQWTLNDAERYFRWFLNGLDASDFDYAEDKFAEMKKEVDKREEIYKKILALKDDEILITWENEYYGTFKKKSMDFQTDTYRYAMVVVCTEK